MILVVAEQREGVLNRASWETIAAAQQAGGPITVAVLGAASRLRGGRARSGGGRRDPVGRCCPALEEYTADGYVAALAGADRDS